MRDEKKNTKAQWMNLQRNSSFINRTRFPLLCEKSGAILLVLLSLTAGRQAVRQNSGRFCNFQISLLIVLLGFPQSLTNVQFCYSVTKGFLSFFHEKYIVRQVMEARESWMPCFFVSIPTIKYYRT